MTTITVAIVRRAITIKRELKKRSRELIPIIKQRIIRAITLQGTITKSPILLSQIILNQSILGAQIIFSLNL